MVFDACHAIRDGDACEAAAAGKGRACNALHAVRDGDAREAAAAGKSIARDARHAAVCRDYAVVAAENERFIGSFDKAVSGRVIDGISLRNSNCFQRGAAFKRICADARHAFRDRDTRKAAAAGKGIACDARHAVRDRDARKAAAAVKGRHFDARHTVRDCDARKAAATAKGMVPDACHACRDRDARKAAAVVKGRAFNACHAFRNGDACKSAAAVKGIGTDIRHIRFNYSRSDRIAFLIPRRGGIFGVRRHCTRAGDSKSTVVRERPRKVVAARAGGYVVCCQQGGFILRGRFFCRSRQDDLDRLLFFGIFFHGEAALGSFIPLRRGEIGICTRREKIAAVLLRENELIHIALRRIDREHQLLRRADKAHAHGLRLRFLCGFSRRFGRGFLCWLGRRLRSRGDRRFLRGFRYRRFGRLRIGGRVSGVLAVDGPRGHGELHGHHDRQKCGKQFLHTINRLL